jgi:hypothetical protein
MEGARPDLARVSSPQEPLLNTASGPAQPSIDLDGLPLPRPPRPRALGPFLVAALALHAAGLGGSWWRWHEDSRHDRFAHEQQEEAYLVQATLLRHATEHDPDDVAPSPEHWAGCGDGVICCPIIHWNQVGVPLPTQYGDSPRDPLSELFPQDLPLPLPMFEPLRGPELGQPVVEVEILPSTHGMEPISLRQAMQRARGRVLGCYREGLSYNPNLEGTVEESFRLGQDGLPEEVFPGGNLSDSGVGRCIRDVVRSAGVSLPAQGVGFASIRWTLRREDR